MALVLNLRASGLHVVRARADDHRDLAAARTIAAESLRVVDLLG